MAVLLALAGALAYGGGDFLGGRSSRLAPPLLVVFLAEGAGLVAIAPLLLFAGTPSAAAMWWGAGAGLLGALGLVAFFQAMSQGSISVVAPIAGVVGTAVPVVAGLALGDHPSRVALAGVALAVLAVLLLTWGAPEAAPEHAPRRAMLGALVAGVFFGAYFVVYSRATGGGALWPVATARLSSVTLLAGIVALRRPPLRMRGGLLALTLLSGCLDVTGNVLYVVAVRRGLLSLVAAVTSLYPGVTIVLAWMLLRERLRRVQVAGLGIAAVAVVLMAR